MPTAELGFVVFELRPADCERREVDACGVRDRMFGSNSATSSELTELWVSERRCVKREEVEPVAGPLLGARWVPSSTPALRGSVAGVRRRRYDSALNQVSWRWAVGAVNLMLRPGVTTMMLLLCRPGGWWLSSLTTRTASMPTDLALSSVLPACEGSWLLQ